MPKDSTNVRTSRQPPFALGAALKLLDGVSPPLAARLGERIFLTPPRHRAPARERELLSSARAFDVPFQGGRLRAWSFGGTPEVLLVHGWAGRGGQMAPFVRPLLNAGHGVVLFDGPGHGASSGRLASVPLFAAAVRVMASHLGTIRAAVAHSMGAPSTALAALEGLPLEAAVFVAPPRSPAAFFDHFCAAFRMPPSLAEGVRDRLERRFGMRLVDFDLPRLARRASLPLLVVHDADDKEVPWESGDAIVGAWPGATLLTTTGLGHRRVLRDHDVLTRATAFIAERLRSGARVCASPSCGRALRGSWDEARHLCGTCALEAQLFSPTLRAATGLTTHRIASGTFTRIATL